MNKLSPFSKMAHQLIDRDSQQTVALLTVNVPEFIEPENWPPNSPNLNPIDYSIWGAALQQLVLPKKDSRPH